MENLTPEEIEILRRWSREKDIYDQEFVSHRNLLLRAADQIERSERVVVVPVIPSGRYRTMDGKPEVP